MGKRYLIDSNVIIDFCMAALPEEGSAFLEKIVDTEFYTSVIVKIEVLGFEHSLPGLKVIEEFLELASLIALDDDVTSRAILLRRSHKKLKLGDAIIAATAIVNNLVLITRNTRDFSNIKGLGLINLWELPGKAGTPGT